MEAYVEIPITIFEAASGIASILFPFAFLPAAVQGARLAIMHAGIAPQGRDLDSRDPISAMRWQVAVAATLLPAVGFAVIFAMMAGEDFRAYDTRFGAPYPPMSDWLGGASAEAFSSWLDAVFFCWGAIALF